MSARFTNEQQATILGILARELHRAGIMADGDRLHLQAGSRTNGIAWRLHMIPAGESYHARIAGFSDYLGPTGDDARRTLNAYADALTAANNAWEGKR